MLSVREYSSRRGAGLGRAASRGSAAACGWMVSLGKFSSAHSIWISAGYKYHREMRGRPLEWRGPSAGMFHFKWKMFAAVSLFLLGAC